MSKRCELCKKEVGETFLGKINGTIVKTKKGDKNEIHYVCNLCQKEHKNKLNEKIK